jgi:hypothetical protein
MRLEVISLSGAYLSADALAIKIGDVSRLLDCFENGIQPQKKEFIFTKLYLFNHPYVCLKRPILDK